jgi:hypothetical protein
METEAEIGLFEVGAKRIEKPHPGWYSAGCASGIWMSGRVQKIEDMLNERKQHISKNENGNAHSFLFGPLTPVNHNVQISEQAILQAITRQGC